MKYEKINLHPNAETLLVSGLAVVATALVAVFVFILRLDGYDRIRLSATLFSMLEHIVMSFVLIFGGSLLFDLAEHEKEISDHSSD